MNKPFVPKIELIEIEKLVPFAKNNKLHPDDQIERLASVMKSQGFDQPIVVDRDMVIIKGHGRRLAALKLGLSKVPVIVRHDLTKEQADAARISDNITTSTAYDTRAMQEELNRLLKDNDFGFTANELGLSKKEQELLLADIEIPDLDSIMTDTSNEIETQKKKDAERVAQADNDDVKLVDAFGFKTVSGEQARAIAHYVAHAEAQTGKTGKEAVIAAFLGALSA